MRSFVVSSDREFFGRCRRVSNSNSLLRQKQLQRDTAPLQAAADVLREYSDGKRKLNKRDLPVIAAEAAKLKAENGQLEERLQISARDQSDVLMQRRWLAPRKRLSLRLYRSALTAVLLVLYSVADRHTCFCFYRQSIIVYIIFCSKYEPIYLLRPTYCLALNNRTFFLYHTIIALSLLHIFLLRLPSDM